MGIEPEGLRQLVATRFRESEAKIEVSETGPLELTLLHGNGRTDVLDLHLLWESVQDRLEAGPTDLEEPVGAYVDGILRLVRASDDERTMIVVIKDRAWVEQAGETTPNLASMPLVGDLFAVMAWHGPEGIDHDMGGDLPQEALMEALNNVLSKVDELTLHGDDPYLLAAGGQFEASLLLAGPVWDQLAEQVDGDLVAAAPTRDVLLVTGTGDPIRYSRFKETIRKPFEDGLDHLLNGQILRWRGGTWVVHDEVDVTAAIASSAS